MKLHLLFYINFLKKIRKKEMWLCKNRIKRNLILRKTRHRIVTISSKSVR